MPEAELGVTLRNAQEPEGEPNPEVEEQGLLVVEEDAAFNRPQEEVAEDGAEIQHQNFEQVEEFPEPDDRGNDGQEQEQADQGKEPDDVEQPGRADRDQEPDPGAQNVDRAPTPHAEGFVLDDLPVEEWDEEPWLSARSESDVRRELEDDQRRNKDGPPTPETTKPDSPIDLLDSAQPGTNSPQWAGSKNYEYLIDEKQPSTDLFGTVLLRLRIRRGAGHVLELCPDAGQRVTVNGAQWTLIMCCQRARIFYVWVHNGPENYLAFAKDVTAVTRIPDSKKGQAEDLRIKVTCFVLLNFVSHVCI